MKRLVIAIALIMAPVIKLQAQADPQLVGGITSALIGSADEQRKFYDCRDFGINCECHKLGVYLVRADVCSGGRLPLLQVVSVPTNAEVPYFISGSVFPMVRLISRTPIVTAFGCRYPMGSTIFINYYYPPLTQLQYNIGIRIPVRMSPPGNCH